MKIKNNLQHKDEDSSLLKSIKSEILESLNKYESHPMSSNLQLSTLCDPRFRQNFIESPVEVKKLAVPKMRNIYTTQKIANPDNFENIETRTKEQNKKRLAKFFNVFGSNSNSESTRNPSQEAEKELNEYLSMPRVSFEHDPLDWWKVHYESFPSLKVLARKYLCIQGSTPSNITRCCGPCDRQHPTAAWMSTDKSSLVIEAQVEEGIIAENNSTPASEISGPMRPASLQKRRTTHKDGFPF
ncbi:t-complex protein 1 subunit delta [Trichonephila clavipes]|nr:t-complex protein 1 subunit delta [Trichonephila clavipes]